MVREFLHNLRPPRLFVGLRGLDRKDRSREIMAGITLAALMIPLNIGYADVAGLPPAMGLYAALVPMIAYAVFATSRNVIAGPDAAIAALIGSTLAALALPDDPLYVQLAIALALLCGVLFLLFWLFRLGYLANYLARPVMVGLISALGLEVLISQIAKIMGVHVEVDGFFREIVELIQSIPRANLYSVALGLGTIAIVRGLRRVAPRLPGALIALVGLTVLVAVLELESRGVIVLGEVAAGLPRLTVPQVSFSEWVKLLPSTVAIVALTAAEGLLLARKYAQSYGYKVDSDQEMLAYGVGNIAAGFTGALVVGASASRTAAMDDAGARSQWPSVVAAGVVAVVLVFFSDFLALIPQAVLAGIVANAVLKLIEVGEMRELFHLRRSEFYVAIICLLGVLVLGTLPGLVITFLLTTIEVVRRASRPRSSVLAMREDLQGYGPRSVADGVLTAPGLAVYRFGGPLFFADADLFRQDVESLLDQHRAELKYLVLDMEAVNDIDTTGAEALEHAAELMKSRGVTPALSRVYPPLPDLLARYELLDAIGEGHVFESNREAVAALTGEKFV